MLQIIRNEKKIGTKSKNCVILGPMPGPTYGPPFLKFEPPKIDFFDVSDDLEQKKRFLVQNQNNLEVEFLDRLAGPPPIWTPPQNRFYGCFR